MKRNLLYFCYPVPGKLLDLNLQELKKNWHVFTGKKILFFAIDKDTLKLTDIISLQRKDELFSDQDMDFYLVKNDSKMRESAHFVRMLTELKKVAEPGSITFFAHSKGIKSIFKNEEPLINWMQSMWMYNMRIAEVETAFSMGSKFVGCFRYDIPYGDIKVNWHYSGTYFWFSYDLFSQNFTKLSMTRYGVESYPATIYSIKESHNLTRENPDDLYNIETWKEKKY
jgi:hypothetical protein